MYKYKYKAELHVGGYEEPIIIEADSFKTVYKATIYWLKVKDIIAVEFLRVGKYNDTIAVINRYYDDIYNVFRFELDNLYGNRLFLPFKIYADMFPDWIKYQV